MFRRQKLLHACVATAFIGCFVLIACETTPGGEPPRLRHLRTTCVDDSFLDEVRHVEIVRVKAGRGRGSGIPLTSTTLLLTAHQIPQWPRGTLEIDGHPHQYEVLDSPDDNFLNDYAIVSVAPPMARSITCKVDFTRKVTPGEPVALSGFPKGQHTVFAGTVVPPTYLRLRELNVVCFKVYSSDDMGVMIPLRGASGGGVFARDEGTGEPVLVAVYSSFWPVVDDSDEIVEGTRAGIRPRTPEHDR